MPQVFSHCPADKFEGDDGCAGCPALPGTEHCEAVFIDAPDPFNGELFHAKNLLADIERNSGAFDHFMDIDRRVLATALRLAIANAPTT